MSHVRCACTSERVKFRDVEKHTQKKYSLIPLFIFSVRLANQQLAACVSTQLHIGPSG